MRDLVNNLKDTQVEIPAVKTATATSDTIDMQGYDSLAVLFNIGDSGDTLSGTVYWTLKLQESDDDSSYSDVAAADIIGPDFNGAATYVIDAPSEDSRCVAAGYVGGKRYVQAVATATGTHTNGTPIGIIALQGHAGIKPVA